MSFHERLREIADTPSSPHAEAVAALLGEDQTEPDSEVLLAIVKPLWTEAPFKNAGFILEGFPRNDDDAKMLVEAGLFVDVAVVLAMEATTGVQRALPKQISAFTAQRDAVVAKRAKIAREKAAARAARKQAWEEAQAAKRVTHSAERAAAREARRVEMGDEYDSDEEDEEDEEEEVWWVDWMHTGFARGVAQFWCAFVSDFCVC